MVVGGKLFPAGIVVNVWRLGFANPRNRHQFGGTGVQILVIVVNVEAQVCKPS